MNKFEKFALAMSVLLYEMRIEDLNNSMLFDDDGEQIPVDFIDKALDSTTYSEQMKMLLRMSVLKDVTANPDEYDMNGDDYVYSGKIYDHAYLVDEYVKALYADTQTKTVYICTHCDSDNVQVKGWVRPNNGHAFVDEIEGDEMGWCDDEGLSSEIQTTEVKRRAEVIGFQVVGDDGTQQEGLIHPQAQIDLEVYSLPQAQAMLDDDNGTTQWKLKTIWTNDVEEPTMMFKGDPRNPDSMKFSDATNGVF